MIRQEIIHTVDTDDIRISRRTSAELKNWETKALATLHIEPFGVARPIKWTPAQNQDKPPNTRWGYYSKQKAAFFAKKGFGRGIPTGRTHKLVQSWEVYVNIDQINRIELFTANLLTYLARFTGMSKPEPPPPAILVRVQNPLDYEQYVTGVNQQGFHKDTGWYYSPDVIQSAFQELEGIVSGL